MTNLYSKRIIELDRIDSTNLYARQLLNTERVDEGTVIWAHEQTSGKGQGENEWISEPGKNLTLSLILFPGFLAADQQFRLNKAVTVAILDFLKVSAPGISFQVKWPNDICFNYLKLGGILITNTIVGSTLVDSIIGIGININQTIFSHDISNPTSLKSIISHETDLKEALNLLIATLDHRYSQLKEGAVGNLDEEYRDCLLGFGEYRAYKIQDEIIQGMIRDIDSYGQLILETSDHLLKTFAHQEIEFIL